MARAAEVAGLSVDASATVNARLAGIGLDATVGDARRRIDGPGGGPAAERELPAISVDLRVPETAGAPRPPPTTDLEVLGLLGKGGMGRVLVARQHSLDREVALKTLLETASPRDGAALVSEGTITGHLEHPSIVPVHALGRDAGGRPVLVMKRVIGVDWAELLENPDHAAWEDERRDRLDAHLEILMQVCNAAHFAHSRGVVHRDIKPQNVLIGRFGEVYLGDWGLALRTHAGQRPEPLCGTPSYMAPEMVRGGAVDARTDVFLLGATLHRVLTGEPRNRGGMHAALASALEIEPYAYPPSVPAELAAVANRATARDPADRQASALALRQELGDYLRHRSSRALAASALERVARLRELVTDEAGLASEARQHELDVVGAEARFALEQARREWSDNPVAREAQAALEELFAGRRARAVELERQARELDPRVSQRQRAVGLAAMAVAGVGLSIVGLVTDAGAVTPRDLLMISFGMLALGVGTVAVLRRHALRTAVNRRAVALLLTMFAGIALSRGLGLAAGLAARQILVYDLLHITACFVLGGALLFRWLAWIAPILLAGAVVTALWPAHALHAFSLATGAGLLASSAFAWRAPG